MLWLFKINFRGFCRLLINDNSSYVVLYTQCLRCNICSAWFLDIRISTCYSSGQFLHPFINSKFLNYSCMFTFYGLAIRS